MIPGRMDRRVRIETPVNTQDTAGEIVQTWATFQARMWARKVSESPSERFDDYRRVAEAVVIWEIRYVSGITPEMRLISISNGDDIHDIVGIEEIGRREGLRITTVAQRDTDISIIEPDVPATAISTEDSVAIITEAGVYLVT